MEPLSELERDMMRLGEAQERVAVVTDRIERLKAEGRPTELYEQLLRNLENSLHLMQAHLRRSMNDLVAYRCYLMSGEHIRGVRMFDAADDAEVLINAGQFLKQHPEHMDMEIWSGKRLVARLSRTESGPANGRFSIP